MGISIGPVASGEPWVWAWQAYLGVWCVLVAVGALLVREWRPASMERGALDQRRRLRLVATIAGWVSLWLAIDWPLGGLAAYLLSAASLQYLVINLVVAPLLLFGLPRVPPSRLSGAPTAPRVWRPPVQLLTAAVFAAVMFTSVVPAFVDGVRASALGSLGLVTVWLVSGVAMWWPVLRRDGGQLRYLAAVAYLFVPFILPKVPGLAYIAADEPVYGVYANAPRVAGLALSPLGDQLASGGILWSAGTAMIFVSLGVLFEAWYRDERRASAPASLQIPADPELVAELFAIPGAWVALERVIGGLESSLPTERAGYELRLAVRERTGRRCVVVELHAPLDGSATAQVAESMTRDLERYLARLPEAQRLIVESHMDFEVVPFRTRAS